MKKTLLFLLVVIFALAGRRAAADENPGGTAPAGLNKSGFYAELAFLGMMPFAGDQVGRTDIGLFGPPVGGVVDLDAGPGGHLALGYDWRYLGVGLKFVYANLNVDSADGLPIYDDDISLFGLDLETRLFFVEWFADPQIPLRPYLLAGIGIGSFVGEGSDAGFDTNFGLGLQWQAFEHFYLGLESGVRSLYAGGNECISGQGLFGQPWTVCTNDDDNVHFVNVALTGGFRF